MKTKSRIRRGKTKKTDGERKKERRKERKPLPLLYRYAAVTVAAVIKAATRAIINATVVADVVPPRRKGGLNNC